MIKNYFFVGGMLLLHDSTSLVDLRLNTKNQLPGYPGRGLKVSVGGGWVTDQLHCHSNLSWAVIICNYLPLLSLQRDHKLKMVQADCVHQSAQM